MYQENNDSYFKAGTKIKSDKLETIFTDSVNIKAYKAVLDEKIFEESAKSIGKETKHIREWAEKAFSPQSTTAEFTFSITEGKDIFEKSEGLR